MTLLATALVALLLVASSCSGAPDQTTDDLRPYVVTAIDYHFHDAHPSLPIPLGRAVQFSNQGRNRHNVTIEGTGYDRTFGPGRRITVDPIGSLLETPGRYPFFCKLHADRAMSGVLILVE
ncbi:MAG: cupredoxin domain-containing protein [Actinomycetota bacterium]